ncbi:WSC-domain-containing protein, partial [Clathrospora elynae]
QTGEACIDFCGAKGYTVAGTEYSGECYCGLTLPFQYSFSGCDMPCAGLSTEVCGGSNHLTVYMKAQSANANSVPPGWYSRGCYMDSVNSRLLKTLVAVPGGSDAMTVALCTSTCGSFGYPLAGLEYAGECYCDTALGFAASMRPLGDCDMPCKGKLTEFCGGPNRLNLY